MLGPTVKATNSKAVSLLGLVTLLCSCFIGFSQTTNSFFEFVQDQSRRQYTHVPHEVLALYYGWFGPGSGSWKRMDANKHEYEITVHHPAKGFYNSHDAATVDSQIDEAKAHGITGFVVSWLGKASTWHDDSLALLVERAEKKDFKIAVYWEQNRDTGQYLVQFSVDDLTYVLERYGKSKAFLKVDGKPVIFVYERVESQAPLSSLIEIIQKTRAKAGDFLLIGHGYRSSLAYLFDGLHTDYSTMPLDLLRDPDRDGFNQFCQSAERQFTEGAQMARQRSRIVCPLIIPGFDNTKSSPARVRADRRDAQTYRALWEAALKTKPDWILISSWNEWAEGTEIEPSQESADYYLQLTAEYARRFLNSATVDAPACSALEDVAPGTAIPADRLLAGLTIAVMMQDLHVDAEFWSLYCGAKAQRLTWPDLIDPKLFNASNFPVLLLALNEHYTSSVKTTDDVTRALIRYLHEGGFLVVLPFGTWPLLYDDSRQGNPHGITDTLSIGVDNGFDQPPGGMELMFQAKTNVLFGLPAVAPFPRTGDLRFVPARRSRVPAIANYVPLVQLKDSAGHLYGDAAAYVENRTFPLYPGKTLYVWMRTAESIGPDVFLPSLFQFISTRLKPLPVDK